jgi:hypothetical protein
MPFLNDGFLSADMGSTITSHRSQYQRSFDLAGRLNIVCQRIMLSAPVSTENQRELTAILLFARALSSFQGAVLMAEQGMPIEARTLARSCLESAFFLGAVANNPNFLPKLGGADAAYERNKVRWMREASVSDAIESLTPEHRRKLEEHFDKVDRLIAEREAAQDRIAHLKIEAAAREGQMFGIYESLYRDLSHRAAHPTLKSLTQHAQMDAQGNVVGLRFGPDTRETGETIYCAMSALLAATAAMRTVFQCSESDKLEVNSLWDFLAGENWPVRMPRPE